MFQSRLNSTYFKEVNKYCRKTSQAERKFSRQSSCLKFYYNYQLKAAQKNEQFFLNQRHNIENHVTDPNLSTSRRRILATNQPQEEISRREQENSQNLRLQNFEDALPIQEQDNDKEYENTWAADQSNRRFCTMPEGESISIQEHYNEEKKKFDSTVQACLICFDNEPNAVNLNCGHGGICYACAIEIMEKSGECYLCRSKISQVLQLDLNSDKQNSDKIQVLQSARMVTSITNI